jgi:glycosyltransferase involved in cell wall biosynthesis
MKTALIVAFHFPPYGAGSGILRILKFCRYLPEFGWRPIVLAASSRAYERVDPTLLAQIPSELPVARAFALDTQRHLSACGHYFGWMAWPDRWSSWILPAVMTGIFLIRRYRADVIVSTYPIASAMLIGYLLHKLTGKPWVADFRDSMTEDEYPADPLTRRIYRWIERKAVDHCERLVFTASSTIEMYRTRYPYLAPEKCLLIPNGYDEEDFAWLSAHVSAPGSHAFVRLLHLGVIYPSERDPRPFFRALARLKKEAQLSANQVRIELRASGNEPYYSQLLRELDIGDLVYLLPPLPYPQALRDAAASEALLIFQAANCDHQIPAKAYEYLRLGKPILALTSHTGDTADLFRECGGATIVDLADENAIYRVLPDFLRAVKDRKHPVADPGQVQRYARRAHALVLAQSLSELVRPGATRLRSEQVAGPGTL